MGTLLYNAAPQRSAESALRAYIQRSRKKLFPAMSSRPCCCGPNSNQDIQGHGCANQALQRLLLQERRRPLVRPVQDARTAQAEAALTGRTLLLDRYSQNARPQETLLRSVDAV